MTGRAADTTLDDSREIKRLRLQKEAPASPQLAADPLAAPPAAAAVALGARQLIDREEYVRLVAQSLQDLGFGAVSQALERASGVLAQPPRAAELQAAVLGGDWEAALLRLPALGLGEGTAAQETAFEVLEAAYLELLEAGDAVGALGCLRGRLAPLGVRADRLRELSLLLLRAGGDPPAAGSPAKRRRDVLRRLQRAAAPGAVLPARRLEALVEQALAAQMSRCPLRNQQKISLSLLRDYTCGPEQLPTKLRMVCHDHDDEAWHLAFSPDGTGLATAGKDRVALLYSVLPAPRVGVLLRHVLEGHSGAIMQAAWSPDGSRVATCSRDCEVKVWSAATGACEATLREHLEVVTSAAWLPDGKRLVTGGLDRQLVRRAAGSDTARAGSAASPAASSAAATAARSCSRRVMLSSPFLPPPPPSHAIPQCIVDVDTGAVERGWVTQAPQDVAVWGSGECLLVTTLDGSVAAYDLTARPACAAPVLVSGSLVSTALAADGRHLLVTTTTGGLQLFDLGEGLLPARPAAPVATFVPPGDSPGQTRSVVHSCLGGLEERFVLSGTEDGRVVMWARAGGAPVAQLGPHRGTVNAVAWSPARPDVCASVGDDGELHIYGVARAAGEADSSDEDACRAGGEAGGEADACGEDARTGAEGGPPGPA